MKGYKKSKLLFKGFMNNLMYKVDYHYGTSYSKPFIISAVITRACNLKCRQCDVWKKNEPIYELNLDEWKCIISKLSSWLGTFCLVITGGEPMLRRDIFELIQYSNEMGIVTYMITNSMLIDKNNAKKLIKSKLDKVTISIDGLAETHDYLRGIKGSFNKSIQAIKFINDFKRRYKSNLKLSINIAITKYNLHEIIDIINVATGNNCSIYLRPIFPIYSTISIKNKWFVNDELWPSNYSEVNKLINNIKKLKESGVPITNSEKHLKLIALYFKRPKTNFNNFARCVAPSRRLFIGSNGDVFLCDHKDTLLGNAIKDDISNIRHNFYNLKTQLKDCGKFCMIKNSGDLDDNVFSNLKTFKTAFS